MTMTYNFISVNEKKFKKLLRNDSNAKPNESLVKCIIDTYFNISESDFEKLEAYELDLDESATEDSNNLIAADLLVDIINGISIKTNYKKIDQSFASEYREQLEYISEILEDEIVDAKKNYEDALSKYENKKLKITQTKTKKSRKLYEFHQKLLNAEDTLIEKEYLLDTLNQVANVLNLSLHTDKAIYITYLQQ